MRPSVNAIGWSVAVRCERPLSLVTIIPPVRADRSMVYIPQVHAPVNNVNRWWNSHNKITATATSIRSTTGSSVVVPYRVVSCVVLVILVRFWHMPHACPCFVCDVGARRPDRTEPARRCVHVRLITGVVFQFNQNFFWLFNS